MVRQTKPEKKHDLIPIRVSQKPQLQCAAGAAKDQQAVGQI